MIRRMLVPLLLLTSWLTSCATQENRYTFSRWMLAKDLVDQKPRGGMTTGEKVKLAAQSPGWQHLQETLAKTTDPLERDRAAILAMVGDFRASFEFVETFGMASDYKVDVPYQSWATEIIFPISVGKRQISLQHILVMTMIRDGQKEGPYVMKHWRQDWSYEPSTRFEFHGRGRFEREKITTTHRQGAWLQQVYQVDDSPRYQALGHWHHDGSSSRWESQSFWRVVPRREYSVRNDYHALEGRHRITIRQTGWIHEQDNSKVVLGANDEPKYLARELGINRYDALSGFDSQPGKDYWTQTKGFWQEVRLVWSDILSTQPEFTVQTKVAGKSLFGALFQFADGAHKKSPAQWRQFAEATIRRHVTTPK